MHNSALEDILAERQRQVTAEGWSLEHDDTHDAGQMARAAACYALSSAGWKIVLSIWPWARDWWKPKDPRRDLVRAGALIIAEIERIDRAASRTGA